MSKNRYFIILGLCIFLLGAAPSVFAVNNLRPTNAAVRQSRLNTARLRVCQARESVIKKRTAQLTKLAVNMEQKFSDITGRVENYYTSKAVPAGKTISNYNQLVSDIQTHKTDVKTALTAAQNASAAFSCSGDDPKSQLVIYRENMKLVKKALSDYRTSIKNLIVAVHSAAGDK